MLRILNSIPVFFQTHYRLDLRALSLMRIAIALVVIADLIIRIQDLTAHYTNDGMWPTDMLEHSGWKVGYWSLHALSGDKSLQVILFSLHLLFALTLLIGFKSRLSTALVYLLYISLHNRNIFILQAGDDLLRLCLVWGILLPWGALYSVDSVLRSKKGKPLPETNTLASIGYLLLICSIYLFTFLLKSGPDWRQDFSAIYYALNLAQLRLPLGDFLLQHPSLHQPLTILVLVLEILIPLFILWPSRSAKSRLWAFVCSFVLQVGFGSTLYVGLFYFICIATAIALLPSSVMEWLEKVLKIKQREEITPSSKINWLTGSVAAIILLLCLSVNISGFKEIEYELSPPLTETVNALRLDQYWAMFSPGVLRKDGWLVYHGSDDIGRQWDIRLNQDYVDYRAPKSIVGMYRSDRWRKWAENMQDERFTFLRPLYCQYILKHFNAGKGHRPLKLMHLYFMERETQPNFLPPKEKKILYSVCDAS
jgi:uncharacterized membrane protein YidH (DUF202 family)